MNSRAPCPAPCEYRWALLGRGGLAQPALCSGDRPLGPVVPRSFCEGLLFAGLWTRPWGSHQLSGCLHGLWSHSVRAWVSGLSSLSVVAQAFVSLSVKWDEGI